MDGDELKYQGRFRSRRKIREVLEAGMEDLEVFTKRLDVINQGLFDNFYYSANIKFKFMRLKPPQVDRGQGYAYSLSLERAAALKGRDPQPWGIIFHLDWEQVATR